MITFTVYVNGDEFTVRMNDGETWKEAAVRAAQRCCGRGADITSWRVDNYEQNRDGVVVRSHFEGAVIGRRDRRGGGYPVLGRASVTWTPRLG